MSDREAIIGTLRDARDKDREGDRPTIPFDEDAAWQAITNVMSAAHHEQERDAATITGAARRDRLEKLAANVDAVQNELCDVLRTPGLIDPFAWAFGTAAYGDPNWADWDHVERELNALLGQVRTVAKWTHFAAQNAADAVVNQRPKKRTITSRLIWKLAPLYRQFTGRKPGRSYDPGHRIAGGPFVRFISSVAAAMGLSADEMRIAEAIKQEQRDEEWFRLHEPQCSAAEAFAQYLMGEK